MPARSFLLALVAGLALSTAGCGGSNNKGRVEGRWKFVTEDAKLRDTSLVFGDDGTVMLDRPMPPQVDMSGETKLPAPPAWRYKLLAGNAAEFYDLPPDATERFGLFPTPNGLARVTIRIETTRGGKYEGREMALTDAGRTLRLTWVR